MSTIEVLTKKLSNHEVPTDNLIDYLIEIQLENMENAADSNTKNEMMKIILELLKLRIDNIPI